MEPQCKFGPSEIAKEKHYLDRYRVYDVTSLRSRQTTVQRYRFVLVRRRKTTWGILNIKRTKRKPMEDNQDWNNRASKRRWLSCENLSRIYGLYSKSTSWFAR